MKMPIIIAEVKTESPFRFKSDKTWGELFAVAEKAGDIISIHTDPRWGGSFDLIRKAKSLTDKPILAKGIHARDEDVASAAVAGADYILVVGRIPEISVLITLGILAKCIIEPNTLAELAVVPETFKAVWNARDLATGGKKTETFAEARKIFKGWLCQASHISTINDVQEGADAVLVGEKLEQFVKSCEASSLR